MGKSLALDIRERVVSLVEDGYSCHAAGRRLQISAASAVRIMQRKRCAGSVSPAAQGRPRRSKLDAASNYLKARLEAMPDITMPGLAAELLEVRRIRATPAMLSRHLIHRLGYTYKKIPDRDRATPQKSARRAIRNEAQTSAGDAS